MFYRVERVGQIDDNISRTFTAGKINKKPYYYVSKKVKHNLKKKSGRKKYFPVRDFA